ncbi:MAG: Cephalosporin hydroxylase [Planctomycetaceae bacterium]|nr:Cephalosporin hydroxylase [Planctomycetaceae bacterium]
MDWIAETVRNFHRLYYERGIHAGHGRGLHADTYYRGVETHKCPFDLWIFQEILHEVRPALVIELGTYLGGTTLFLAHQVELFGYGAVISIDCRELPRPVHPKIQYILGATQSADVQQQVQRLAATAAGPVLVIHDADHHYSECLADLEAYAGFVTPGSYLIVEDTNVNGHPVLVDWGQGPWEAAEKFLAANPDFSRDLSREKFMLTYNPGGYLRKAGSVARHSES